MSANLTESNPWLTTLFKVVKSRLGSNWLCLLQSLHYIISYSVKIYTFTAVSSIEQNFSKLIETIKQAHKTNKYKVTHSTEEPLVQQNPTILSRKQTITEVGYKERNKHNAAFYNKETISFILYFNSMFILFLIKILKRQ